MTNRLPSMLEKGFTLLEVLVAMTIFAMIAAVLFSGFAMITKAWKKGESRIEKSERARSVYQLIRHQIVSIYPVLPQETPELDDNGNPIRRLQSSKIPYFRGDSERVTFVSLFSLRSNSIPGLCFVAYVIEPSHKGGGYSLVEYEKRYTGMNPMSGNGDNQQSLQLPENIYRYVLLDGLLEAKFQYYGLDFTQAENVPAEEMTKSWIDQWNVEEQGDLPEAIRFIFKSQGKMASFEQEKIIVPIRSHGNGFRRRFPNRRGHGQRL